MSIYADKPGTSCQSSDETLPPPKVTKSSLCSVVFCTVVVFIVVVLADLVASFMRLMQLVGQKLDVAGVKVLAMDEGIKLRLFFPESSSLGNPFCKI